MALVKCKECKAEISSTVTKCPQCGVKIKKPIGAGTGILLVAIVAGAAVWGGRDTTSTASSSVSGGSSNATVVNNNTWRYSRSEKDKMSGKIEEYAELDSDTTLNFKFPYSGGSKATLVIWRLVGEKDFHAQIIVAKGQFLNCISDNCPMQVKFDEGKPKLYYGGSPYDGRATIRKIWVEQKLGITFINELRHSKHLIISATFYDHPEQQMEFSTAGFNW